MSLSETNFSIHVLERFMNTTEETLKEEDEVQETLHDKQDKSNVKENINYNEGFKHINNDHNKVIINDNMNITPKNDEKINVNYDYGIKK